MRTISKEGNVFETPTTPSVDYYSTAMFSEGAETPNPAPQTNNKELPKPPTSFRIGWRFSMACGLVCTALTLLCNIIIMIWSSQQPETGDDNFLLFSGDCAAMKTIDTLVHLAINVLSTLLLGASNYAVQVLMAPTRKDVDTAHALHKSVNIAVPSIANWTSMTLQRRTLFLVLLITSLPLHLIYNSVIFSTESGILYQATTVSSDFLQHDPTISPWNDAIPQNATFYNIYEFKGNNSYGNLSIAKVTVTQLWDGIKSGLFTTMDPDQCYNTFLNVGKSIYSNIVLFTDFSSDNRSLLSSYTLSLDDTMPTRNYWCSMVNCSQPDKQTVPFWAQDSTTRLNVAQATSCAVQQGPRQCTVELIPKLMAVVIICNFLKCVALTYVLFSNTGSEPLLTLGDAIASFLDVSDKYTDCQGGLSAVDIRKNPVLDAPKVSLLYGNTYGWRQPHRRYFSSVPLILRMVTLQLFLNYYTFALGFLLVFYVKVGASVFYAGPTDLIPFSQQWQDGFGALIANSFYQPQMTDPTNTTIANAMWANAPQLYLSFVYVAYNGFLTYMSVSAEWAGYVQEKKRGLRVTSPAGQQRSAYWLSLPLKMSITLLVTFGILHWLLSQSVYNVLVKFLVVDGTDSGHELNVIAWSPLMLTVFLAAIGIMFLALLAFSLQKFPPGIPIVSSNSWVISAGCHAIKPGESLQKVHYGVISDLEDEKYHVGFSSGVARPLVPGEYYR